MQRQTDSDFFGHTDPKNERRQFRDLAPLARRVGVLRRIIRSIRLRAALTSDKAKLPAGLAAIAQRRTSGPEQFNLNRLSLSKIACYKSK
jgi:hypothetical protein